jgi:hypothetical protein
MVSQNSLSRTEVYPTATRNVSIVHHSALGHSAVLELELLHMLTRHCQRQPTLFSLGFEPHFSHAMKLAPDRQGDESYTVLAGILSEFIQVLYFRKCEFC